MSHDHESTGLAPSLREIVDRLDVDLDGLTVTCPEETLTADTARDLRQMLSGYLYTTFHIRRPEAQEGGESTFHRDEHFEKTLADHTPHRWTVSRGRIVDGSTRRLVLIDGVRVAVADEAVLSTDGDSCRVRTPACRPVLSPGFFLVDGSVGRFPRGDRIHRFYLSIDDRARAPEVWERTLRALESAQIGYRAKIGSSDRTYPRTDAMVIYVSPSDPAIAGPEGDGLAGLLETLVDDGLPVSDSTSAYTRPLCRGIATAEEPADPRPGMSAMSFGEHRSYALATGLLTSTTSVLDVVHDALVEARIDPSDPSRNLGHDS